MSGHSGIVRQTFFLNTAISLLKKELKCTCKNSGSINEPPLITGGGRGIGLATAEALAEGGARVIISDMNATTLAEGADYLKSKGYDAATMLLDVTDSAACTQAAEEANQTYGAVDILIANGIARPDTPAEEMSDEAWLTVLNVNLNGVYWSCRALPAPCSNDSADPSSQLARCRASSPTSRNARFTTTLGKQPCII